MGSGSADLDPGPSGGGPSATDDAALRRAGSGLTVPWGLIDSGVLERSAEMRERARPASLAQSDAREEKTLWQIVECRVQPWAHSWQP